MAFVEKGAQRPVLSCFLAELDLSNKSILASSSILEKQKDTNVQGLFATRAVDCLSKSSIANDSTLQLASASAIPHWMSSNQVQTTPIDTSSNIGSTRNVVSSMSMPRFLQVHDEAVGDSCTLPSRKVGFGFEEKTNSNIGIDSLDGLANCRHPFQQQVPARQREPICLMPSLSFKSDGQKEEPKISKEDTFSFLIHKQEKQQLAKDHLTDLPILSLGHSGVQLSHERAEVSSWVSRFPFQIASTLEQAERGQLIQHRENLGDKLLSISRSESLIQGACKKVVDVSSQFMGSEGQMNHCTSSMQHFLSSKGAANDVTPQKTSPVNASLNSQWPLPATISGSNSPSLKRDWNATLMQGVKHSQLPEFFAQRKVTVAAKANLSHFLKSEHTQMGSRGASSQKRLASRVSEENSGFNSSLHGTICSDHIRNSLIDHKSIKQQEVNNGVEALKTRTPSSDSQSQVNLFKVKLDNLAEDSKAFEYAKFASRKSSEKHDKTVSSEGTAILSSSGPAADQAVRQPLSIANGMVGSSRAAELMLFRDAGSTEFCTVASAGVPSLSLVKHSSNSEGLEQGKFSAEKDWPLDGNFLAAPSIGQTAEINNKLMLPFQQRFEQLQNFLKKCDGSNDEYCLRALWSLKGSARSNQSAELESRALRLYLEEGKEMKRAKLLNVLEELPEGECMNPHATPMAPWFSASRNAAVVKEEA